MRALYVKHKLTELIAAEKVVAITCAKQSENPKFILESHDFWELIYCDKGSFDLKINNKVIKLKEGEVYIIDPNTNHHISDGTPFTADIFVIGFTTSSPAMKTLSHFHSVLPLDLYPLLTKILTEGSNVYEMAYYYPNMKNMRPKKGQPIGGEQLIKIHIEELLLSLLRYQTDQEPHTNLAPYGDPESHLVCDIVEYISANVNYLITVNDICEKFHFSKTYLSTLFKNATGCSMLYTLTLLKIWDAEDLIRRGEYSITEISRLECYETPQYFSRAFKKMTGMTPQEYRRSLSEATKETD